VLGSLSRNSLVISACQVLCRPRAWSAPSTGGQADQVMRDGDPHTPQETSKISRKHPTWDVITDVHWGQRPTKRPRSRPALVLCWRSWTFPGAWLAVAHSWSRISVDNRAVVCLAIRWPAARVPSARRPHPVRAPPTAGPRRAKGRSACGTSALVSQVPVGPSEEPHPSQTPHRDQQRPAASTSSPRCSTSLGCWPTWDTSACTRT
jgi:hypothetical protein